MTTIESAIKSARKTVAEFRELGPMIVTSEEVEALEGQIDRLERVKAKLVPIDQAREDYHE